MDQHVTWYAGRPRSRPHCVRRGHTPWFSAHVCYHKTAGWIKIPLGREVGFGPSNTVLDRDPVHPIFGPCQLRPNGWMDQDATWYGGRPWSRPHYVRWGPKLTQKGHSQQFLAHVCCDETAGWIKIPPGRKVGLGSRHILLNGEPTSPFKRGTAPNFRPTPLVPKWSPISATTEHLMHTLWQKVSYTL